MKSLTVLLATASVLGFIAQASAAVSELDTYTIRDLKPGKQVKIMGAIKEVENEREFTLQDQYGTIRVELQPGISAVLEKGAVVTVNGTLDKGLIGADINADNVVVHKTPAQIAQDAIEGATLISFEGAAAYQIEGLPDEGTVKISGLVTEVDSEEKFTVEDETGAINVEMNSDQRAALAIGSEVTVIGTIKDGLMRKEISASKVIVISASVATR